MIKSKRQIIRKILGATLATIIFNSGQAIAVYNKTFDIIIHNDKENKLLDFEKDFFARTQSGEKSQLFMTVATAGESTMIRSLLFADGIPSHSEGEHMNNIYGGITGSMAAVVAVRIYILCSDYERAVDIIKKFDLKKGNIILQPQG